MQEKECFLAFLRRPSDVTELQAGTQFFAAEEFQLLRSFMHSLDETLQELIPLLPQIDTFHASALALLCGGLVENGGDVHITIDTTLELMRSQLKLAQTYVQEAMALDIEEAFRLFPDATRAHHGLPFTLLAAMTMLSRDKEARKHWRLQEDVRRLVNDLEEHYATLYYIKEVFSLLDDQELLVLDPLNRRGFHVVLEGVQDKMYHCYALLQHALLEHMGPGYLDAKPTDPLAVRYAKNDSLTDEEMQQVRDISDEQHFHFAYPAALSLENGNYNLNPLLFFPGSASYFELSSVDGIRTLLIGKRVVQFMWEPANMYPILHDALTSSVKIVRELEAGEVEEKLQHILQKRGR